MPAIDLNKINRPHKKENAAEKKSALDFLNKDIKLFGSAFNDKKKERFYSELFILFSAGVDIRSALELIEEEQAKEKDRLLFASIKESIIAGNSLSKALQQTGLFTMYEYYSLQIGEESGRLTEVLTELSIFFTKKIQQKSRATE